MLAGLLLALGVAAVVLDEADDGPSLPGLGGLLVLGTLLPRVRAARRG